MSIVENLVSKGGREWAGKRVYVGEALACSLMGLRVTRYGSGNVSSAAMNGSPISNRDAAAYLTAAKNAYYDIAANKFVCQGFPGLASALREAVAA